MPSDPAIAHLLAAYGALPAQGPSLTPLKQDLAPCHPCSVQEPELWIVAIAEGADRDAFIALFQHFAPRVKGYFIRQGVTSTLAEELSQETLLTVWRKAEQYDPVRAKAATWVFTIARNLHIDFIRRERRATPRHVVDVSVQPQNPEEVMKAVEGEERVRAAVDSLPLEQAKVLLLSFFEEKTHTEIATCLGLPLGTVKSRIRLAAAHLRLVLDDLV